MATRKKTTKAQATEEVTVKEETATVAEPVQEVKSAPKRTFDLHEYVTVRNGFQGRLVYVSKKTGEVFNWYSYGDELDMELIELRDAKTTAKKMFVNNYFVIEDKEVMDYLGITKFYNKAIPIDCFDDLFDLPPEELKKTVAELPAGQKSSVAYRARTLVENDAIDSLKTIYALEEALGIELLERD